MPSTGIVLGAGGIIGPAYHLSVLRARRAVTGRDPADASLFVGTSGGAIVSALLATGQPLDDLVDAFDIDGAGTRRVGDALQDAVQVLLTLPHLGWGEFHLPPRTPRRRYPDVRQRIARRSSALFTNGEIDPLRYAESFDDVFAGVWPATLRLCTVHCASGRRRVFGPADGARLTHAVAASCAVPGMFRPVRIDGDDYSDGGFFSPTNADVALGHRLDQVTVVSPMSSRPRSIPASVEHPLRVGLHAIVAREQRQLRRHGIEVTLVEPNYAARKAIGADYMDLSRAPAVARAMTLLAPPAATQPLRSPAASLRFADPRIA